MSKYKIYKKEQILRLVKEQETNGYFDNWIMPSNQDLELEYKIEYTFKGLGYTIYRAMKSLGYNIDRDVFPTESEFVDAVHDSEIVTVDPELDAKIEYRSNCPDMDCIIDLIRGYASYPTYRNEQTVQKIWDGFDENAPMKMPIVLKFDDDYYRVMGGNTRMDIAFMKDINPRVIMIDLRNYASK